MSYYVIIRGPLGVGKSTVSAALAESIGAQVISIDAIADKEWDGGSVGLYLKANLVAARLAQRALGTGTPVVIDGCFYWKTQISDLERRLNLPHEVVTLAAPLSVCIERDSKRKISFGSEAVEHVYRKTSRFAYGTAIDAVQSVRSAVKEIRSHLPRD